MKQEIDNTLPAWQCVAGLPATLLLPQAGPEQTAKSLYRAQDQSTTHSLLEQQDFKGTETWKPLTCLRVAQENTTGEQWCCISSWVLICLHMRKVLPDILMYMKI